MTRITGTLRYILRHMLAACWLIKATDTRLEYVIFIVSRPQKQLREKTSIVRCCALLVLFSFIYNICP